MPLKYTFDYAFRALLILLPFMTVLTVFFREKLGVPGFSFLKEILLFSLIVSIAWAHLSGRKRIELSRYDYAIGTYILLMIVVSLFTTGFTGIVYGGRYDFSFLIAFLAIYHGYNFLEREVSYYLRLFLYSGGIMILISFLLKWPLSEDLLLYIGYSGNPSNWQFGSAPPIFHGVDGANVRRLQGLLDGPNTMGAFLLMYMGVLVYYLRGHKSWHFVLGIAVLVIALGIFYTYSRSAALGLIGGVGIIILFQLRVIFQKYAKQFITIIVLFTGIIGIILFQYSGSLRAIIERGGSTNGHMERMIVGIERTLSSPFGSGLGSAGPAYRYVQNLEGKDRKEIEEIDRYYIPESWYIQQSVEGGILGLMAFLVVIILLWVGLFRKSVILGGMFFSLLIMNMFLHTFESAVLSLSLFLIVGLLIASYHAQKKL